LHALPAMVAEGVLVWVNFDLVRTAGKRFAAIAFKPFLDKSVNWRVVTLVWSI
jgi:hypothetical protein